MTSDDFKVAIEHCVYVDFKKKMEELNEQCKQNIREQQDIFECWVDIIQQHIEEKEKILLPSFKKNNIYFNAEKLLSQYFGKEIKMYRGPNIDKDIKPFGYTCFVTIKNL